MNKMMYKIFICVHVRRICDVFCLFIYFFLFFNVVYHTLVNKDEYIKKRKFVNRGKLR